MVLYFASYTDFGDSVLFRSFISAACITLYSLAFAPQAQAQENVMIVFDGSNSMWGQIDGVAKIEIARNTIGNLVGGWTQDREVGLIAYGHRRRGDCGDIETLVTPQAGVTADIIERVKGISPRGKTPLTDAVEAAAKALAYQDKPATVVLISDGLESCERDPCALAKVLEQGGVGFTAHVVGFGLGGDQDTASLSCLADETGGIFVQAENASELEAALGSVSAAVAEAPVPATEPEPVAAPEPEPEPEPAAPTVVVNGPETAVGGSNITVTWDPTVDAMDYINILPLGSKDGTYGQYQQVRTNEELTLMTPGKPGAYEIRYTAKSGETLGSSPLEITQAEVALEASDLVVTGAQFTVGWTPTINPLDYIGIVPVGSEAGTFGSSYMQVRNKSEVQLTAPAQPGLYELRYILRVDNSTVGTRAIEVSAPEVTLSAPETALTGEEFMVSWTGKVSNFDYITIVPVGTPEGEYGNYQQVRGKSELPLQAPAEVGLYEVRYVLREGNKTMTSTPIEIVSPEVTVSAPETVRIGEVFNVEWTGTVNPRDYVTIVPIGTAEGEFGNYFQVRSINKKELQAPADPGFYEVRYVLREGSKTMATAAVEVVQADVSLTAPATALTGQDFEVSWDGQVSTLDYITIVPKGTAEGEFGNYFQVRKHGARDLLAPADPGFYEVRYVLKEGGKTMASADIELVVPEVTVSGPDKVRANTMMQVMWSSTVNVNDYITLVPLGSPDDDFSEYFLTRDKTEREMETPAEPGVYELRYVLKEGTRVLARKTIDVVPETAALNTGAKITAPESASAGSAITVRWQVEQESSDQRVTLADPDQAIFTWISASKINGLTEVQMTLPDQPGVYELRILDIPGQEVLARQQITVK